jgi:hypothetical protein
LSSNGEHDGVDKASTEAEVGQEVQSSENANLEVQDGVALPAEMALEEPVDVVSNSGEDPEDVVGTGEESAEAKSGEENQFSETADSGAQAEPVGDLSTSDGEEQGHLNDEAVAAPVYVTEANPDENVEASESYDFDEAELPPLVGSESEMAMDEPSNDIEAVTASGTTTEEASG